MTPGEIQFSLTEYVIVVSKTEFESEKKVRFYSQVLAGVESIRDFEEGVWHRTGYRFTIGKDK